MKRKQLVILARLVAAVILLQTLFYKFTAHPDSVQLFTLLGAEPYGRIFLGIVELVTALLLLVPGKTNLHYFGALISFSLMIGALVSHFFVLGVDYNGDHGSLFLLAIVTLIASGFLILHYSKYYLKQPIECRPWFLKLLTA